MEMLLLRVSRLSPEFTAEKRIMAIPELILEALDSHC